MGMNINEADLDLLKEIGNIGAGNAASALSEMIGQTVTINVPRCELIKFSEMTNIIGDPEHVILGILVQLQDDMEGYILLAQELEDAVQTVKALMGQDVSIEDGINLEDFDLMKEVTNILAGSYLSAISEMTGMRIDISIPAMTADMAMAIMNVPALVYGEVGESVLMLDTQFGGAAECIHGHFFLIPTIESLEKLKKALNM